MSNISHSAVRNTIESDPRIARTTRALGRALIELIQERPFSAITVQNILDRARVGRTAFYAHYRNKEDVLHSSYERLFAALEPMLEQPSAIGTRLFPVREFLDHVGESQELVGALRRDGRLEAVWALCCGHAARLIARRIENTASTNGVPRQLVAHMLAGALVEMIKWWLDHPSAATTAQMDVAFHELARAVRR